MAFRRILERFFSDRRGVAFAEFSVLFPVLLALAVGVFEFGRGLQHFHAINKAVRDSARYLARVPTVACTTAGAGAGTVSSTYVTQARNLALNGSISGGSPVLSYWTNPATVSVAVDCIDRTTPTPDFRETAWGDYLAVMRVTAAVPYSDLGFLSVLGLGGFTFTVDHSQVHTTE